MAMTNESREKGVEREALGMDDKQSIDPVCGMRVTNSDQTLSAEHKGVKYQFCSAACRNEFQIRPASFVSA